ncbi:MAG: hypothetical protein AAGA48_26770 [Myxococcota bacterium]
MEALVDTLVALPLEVQGAVLLGTVLAMLITVVVVSRRRRDPRSRAPVTQIDPILVPNDERKRMRLEAIDFDSQNTLIPAGVAGEGPFEQIDLLSPARDQAVARAEAPDAAAIASAKERLKEAALRGGARRRRDNLSAIRGLSPLHARKLQRVGLITFSQLAQLTDDEIADLAMVVGCPQDRIAADDWIGQARAALRQNA